MKRILVTGGAGYVGSHCVKQAAQSGYDCVVFDSLVHGHREFVRWGPLVEGDIRSLDQLADALVDHRIDAVMHFAALAYVGQSVIDPASYYDVNVRGTLTLLEAMRRTGTRHLVLSSSCAVYGEPAQMPISETTVPAPINPYGYTKLVCERMIEDYGRAYGLRSVRLRYFNAAGADPAGEIGEHHEPETHLIPLVLDAALGRRASISVFGADYPTPDGTAVRDYIHVADLATAHVRALAYLAAGGEGLSVNLGTGRGVSVGELIAACRRLTGRPIEVTPSPRRPGDPAVLVAARGRAEQVLGWQPQRSDLDTIIADAWRWHRKRFDGKDA